MAVISRFRAVIEQGVGARDAVASKKGQFCAKTNLIIDSKGTKEPVLLLLGVDLNEVAANIQAVVVSVKPNLH